MLQVHLRHWRGHPVQRERLRRLAPRLALSRQQQEATRSEDWGHPVQRERLGRLAPRLALPRQQQEAAKSEKIQEIGGDATVDATVDATK